MNIPILFEDDHFLCIDKPAGVVVNRADSVSGETLQDWFDATYPACLDAASSSKHAQLFRERSGLVHRLDKDTSGCMVLAKTPESMVEIMRQFKAREVHKTYQALVHGRLEPMQGSINLPIARNPLNRHTFTVQPFGRPSETMYAVGTYYHHQDEKQDTYTLVSLYPKTGRTHQIRVHMTHLKHPLVADQLYASKKMIKRDTPVWPRQCLHARAITFAHPDTGEPVDFTSPLAIDIAQGIESVLCQAH